jgi:hypothetical protein
VESVLKGLTAQEIDRIADEWLERRAPSSESRNEFAALWHDELPESLRRTDDSHALVAGLFTSSQDEFQFLGPEWQLHDWDDQFTAFDLILDRLEARGYSCYLRVHPNLATKRHDYFVRERDGIRRLAAKHPQLTVVWHDDFANTYALLGQSDIVVVWDSTVGLEASARGIPTWTTATTRYGLVANVRELLSAESLDREDFVPWTVDTHAAKAFIAYLVLRDQQMAVPADSWYPWDRASAPLGTAIAAALVSGSIPYKREAVRSIIDVYRHRSLRSNLKHVRNR